MQTISGALIIKSSGMFKCVKYTLSQNNKWNYKALMMTHSDTCLRINIKEMIYFALYCKTRVGFMLLMRV